MVFLSVIKKQLLLRSNVQYIQYLNTKFQCFPFDTLLMGIDRLIMQIYKYRLIESPFSQ